ncbi:MAG TPA: response regulator transcription factor [Hyphomicrobiales bacterium]
MSSTELTPVLLIEDDPPIRRLLRTSLGANGFEVIEAAGGRDGLHAIRAQKPELVVLDLGLPDMDGLEVIRSIRGSGDKIPIIVLSSRGEEGVKVEALDLGADDYVIKPFGMAELIARIRTALRHRLQVQGAEPVFESGALRVDLVRRLVTLDGADVKLSPKEYDILRLLVLNAGKVLTHRYIMNEIWGAGGDVQYLRIYVRQLRAKIEARPEQPEHILTETGVGYRLQ